MLLQSKYRLMGKAGWGIAINISAEWIAIDAPPMRSTQIADGVWFACEDARLDADELRNLMLGVKMGSQAIAKKKPAGKAVLIKFSKSSIIRPITSRRGWLLRRLTGPPRP